MISNSVVQTLMGGFVFFINFFLIPVFIHNLGVELYGIWILAGVITGSMGLFDLGFTNGLERKISHNLEVNDYSELSRSIWAALSILVFIGILCSFLIYVFRMEFITFFNVSSQHVAEAEKFLKTIAFFALITWPMKIGQMLLHAAMLHRIYVVLSTITISSTALLLIFMVHIGQPLWQLQLAKSGISLIAFGFTCWIIYTRIKGLTLLRVKGWLRILKETFNYSLGMFYSRLLSMLSIQIDSILLGRMVGLESVAAYKITTIAFSSINELISKFLGANISAIYHIDASNDKKMLKKFLYEGIKYRALFAIPLSATAVCLLPSFLTLWVGPEFTKYAIWGQVYMIVHITDVLGVAVNIFRGIGKLRILNSLGSIRTIVNLLLSILLIPYFGLGGALLGTIITAIFIGNPVIYPYICRILKIPAKPAFMIFLKIVLVSVFPFVILLYLTSNITIDNWGEFVIAGITCVSCFLFTLYLFILNEQDKKNIQYAVSVLPARFFPLKTS